MSKKDLSEADICDRYITLALHEAGWRKSQIRREYGFTDGQMIVRGQMAMRDTRKRTDYLLYYPANQSIAVIEAEDNKHSVRTGITGFAITLFLNTTRGFRGVAASRKCRRLLQAPL